MIITEINTITGDENVREMNTKELKQLDSDRAMKAKAAKAKEKAEADKAVLLARLGLTEDELKTILG
jgi:hypothetical protein